MSVWCLSWWFLTQLIHILKQYFHFWLWTYIYITYIRLDTSIDEKFEEKEEMMANGNRFMKIIMTCSFSDMHYWVLLTLACILPGFFHGSRCQMTRAQNNTGNLTLCHMHLLVTLLAHEYWPVIKSSCQMSIKPSWKG